MEITLCYIFFVFSIYWVFHKKSQFIYFLPLFSIGMDMTFTYFAGFSLPAMVRVLVMILLLYYMRRYIKITSFTLPFIVFFVWLSILLVMSNEYSYSLKGVVQVISSMTIFIVSYFFFTSQKRLDRLLNSLFWVVLVAVVTVLLGYFFDIGRSLEYTQSKNYEYEEEVIGLLGSGGLYAPAMIIAALPLIYKMGNLSKLKKKVFPIIVILLYVFVILNVRRTAILIPIVGLLGFLVYAKQKRRYIQYIIYALISITLSYPLYADTLQRRLTSRQDSGRLESDFYKTEMRYLENMYLFGTIAEFDEPIKILFGIGNNVFAENIQNGNKVSRMYHTDLAKLLYGVGLLGIGLYLFLYISIFVRIRKLPSGGDLSYYKATAFGFFLISIFISINGSLTNITFRSINFLLLGATLGFANARIKEIKQNRQQNKLEL